ncbi:MAG: methyltransferase domain-containing protein [Halioglobus sp.]|nr:methyltransferase domain-containing protein [Halioglobus sp.]
MRSECSDISTELESWYASDNGRYLLEETRGATQNLLDTTFGYHILQLGVRTPQPLAAGSPIHHRVYSAPTAATGANLVAVPDELPLDCDSVDAVIAHHCLEFAEHPQQVLREIQRVLTPQGQLLLVCFNPWSLKGLAGRTSGVLRHPLWSGYKALSQRRLMDWLHLLGCEVQGCKHLYGVPVAGKGRVRNFLQGADRFTVRHNVPVGGIFILHATKQVAGVHPRRRLSLVGRERLIGLVPKPSAAPSPATPAPRDGVTYHRDNNTQ